MTRFSGGGADHICHNKLKMLSTFEPLLYILDFGD
uniref:Uncharacterized protein n=1 Tax=Arundo donax TaxID=35708 RepID=A0A0A8YTB1_ARUDO